MINGIRKNRNLICHFFWEMDELTSNFSQNCVNAYLINGDEKSQLISVNQDYTVNQLRSFLYVYHQ